MPLTANFARGTGTSSVGEDGLVKCRLCPAVRGGSLLAVPANLFQYQPSCAVFHIMCLKYHRTPWSVHVLPAVVCGALCLGGQCTNCIILLSESSRAILSILILFDCSKLFPLILTRMRLQPQQYIIQSELFDLVFCVLI